MNNNLNNMYRSDSGCGCGNVVSSAKNGKRALLDEINTVSFAADELRLYLDTHPDNGEALDMMKEYLDKRGALIERFGEKYGALDGYGMIYGDEWRWNDPPMPWSDNEGGC